MLLIWSQPLGSDSPMSFRSHGEKCPQTFNRRGRECRLQWHLRKASTYAALEVPPAGNTVQNDPRCRTVKGGKWEQDSSNSFAYQSKCGGRYQQLTVFSHMSFRYAALTKSALEPFFQTTPQCDSAFDGGSNAHPQRDSAFEGADHLDGTAMPVSAEVLRPNIGNLGALVRAPPTLPPQICPR